MLTVEGYSDFQKINERLYIGNQISALQRSRLREEAITHVLKVNGITQMFPASVLGIEVKVVSLEDHEDYEISDADLDECFNFMRGASKTLVVCTAGISRSATICIAYLMRYEGLSLDQAHAKVKAARRFVKPNPGFMRFLERYE